MKQTIFRLMGLSTLLYMGTAAHAQAGLQNLDALERRLVIALQADIGQPGGPTVPLDRRLRLMACPSDVLIDPPALGAVALRCPQIGWRIRVPLVRDPAAQPAAVTRVAQAAAPVKAAPVIRRGDPVELRAGQGAFLVSSQVVAEQDGAPGDRIRVRADTRSAAVMAEVVDSGIVRLPGFNGN